MVVNTSASAPVGREAIEPPGSPDRGVSQQGSVGPSFGVIGPLRLLSTTSADQGAPVAAAAAAATHYGGGSRRQGRAVLRTSLRRRDSGLSWHAEGSPHEPPPAVPLPLPVAHPSTYRGASSPMAGDDGCVCGARCKGVCVGQPPEEILLVTPPHCAAAQGRYVRVPDPEARPGSRIPYWQQVLPQDSPMPGHITVSPPTPAPQPSRFSIARRKGLWCVTDTPCGTTCALLRAARSEIAVLPPPPLPTQVPDWMVPERSNLQSPGTVPMEWQHTSGVILSSPMAVDDPFMYANAGQHISVGKQDQPAAPPPPATRYDQTRRRLNKLVEEPDSSRAAAWFARFTLIVIIASTVTLLVESLPKYQVQSRNNTGPWWSLELSFVVYFSLEIIFRVWSAESRCLFFTGALNIVDIIAVAPFYMELIMAAAGMSSEGAGGLRVLRVVRVVRVFRLLKVARYAEGIQTIAVVIKQSRDVLLLVLFIVIISLIFASSFMFYLEGISISTFDKRRQFWNRTDTHSVPDNGSRPQEYSPFQSIPHTFWWCIATFTLVGYGDEFPKSGAGQAVAAVSMVTGTFILAIPASVFGSNFLSEYGRRRDDKRERKEDSERRNAQAVVALLNMLAELGSRRPEWASEESVKHVTEQLLWDEDLSKRAVQLIERAQAREGVSPSARKDPSPRRSGTVPISPLCPSAVGESRRASQTSASAHASAEHGPAQPVDPLLENLRPLWQLVETEARRRESKRKKQRRPALPHRRVGDVTLNALPTSIGVPCELPYTDGPPGRGASMRTTGQSQRSRRLSAAPGGLGSSLRPRMRRGSSVASTHSQPASGLSRRKRTSPASPQELPDAHASPPSVHLAARADEDGTLLGSSGRGRHGRVTPRRRAHGPQRSPWPAAGNYGVATAPAVASGESQGSQQVGPLRHSAPY
eukprot:TRINITY_DN60105_c0_g1_i1.p1 TRINITY_DN60105_c0_g1~~TRINITY_DN60105_c0_g1_i1.p1  ORF type:complete len:925 (+),score=194.89 TRINITY_DN60105_c0_g1_i1:101-2875(+)